MLTAVAISGIVFSFNGFQSPVNLAGEARNPGAQRAVRDARLDRAGDRRLPAAAGRVPRRGGAGAPGEGGWRGSTSARRSRNWRSLVNLNWLAMLLYFDAFVSPSGTGITYTATPRA